MLVLGSAFGVVVFRAMRLPAPVDRLWSVERVSNLPAAAFVVTHRREFHVAAVAGCMFTILYAVDGFASGTAPALWPFVVLAVGSIALRACAQGAANKHVADHRDWMSVPRPLRMALRSASAVLMIAEFGLALAVLSAVFGLIPNWLGKSPAPPGGLHLSTPFQVIAFRSIATLYGLEALFFRYGELRPPHD
jgi:hypothetical protein